MMIDAMYIRVGTSISEETKKFYLGEEFLQVGGNNNFKLTSFEVQK